LDTNLIAHKGIATSDFALIGSSSLRAPSRIAAAKACQVVAPEAVRWAISDLNTASTTLNQRLGDHLCSHVGNQAGRGRRAPLIVDDAQFLALLGEPQHRQQEVATP
jgi:hypothetical protein